MDITTHKNAGAQCVVHKSYSVKKKQNRTYGYSVCRYVNIKKVKYAYQKRDHQENTAPRQCLKVERKSIPNDSVHV